LWTDLHALHDFDRHELVAFERALEWWDRSDQWLEESKAATGQDRSRLVKQSLDAATAALRCWKTLRFAAPGGTSKRPGRPSDSRWSAMRGAGRAHS
jgi:hypothetical protein